MGAAGGVSPSIRYEKGRTIPKRNAEVSPGCLSPGGRSYPQTPRRQDVDRVENVPSNPVEKGPEKGCDRRGSPPPLPLRLPIRVVENVDPDGWIDLSRVQPSRSEGSSSISSEQGIDRCPWVGPPRLGGEKDPGPIRPVRPSPSKARVDPGQTPGSNPMRFPDRTAPESGQGSVFDRDNRPPRDPWAVELTSKMAVNIQGVHRHRGCALRSCEGLRRRAADPAASHVAPGPCPGKKKTRGYENSPWCVLETMCDGRACEEKRRAADRGEPNPPRPWEEKTPRNSRRMSSRNWC